MRTPPDGQSADDADVPVARSRAPAPTQDPFIPTSGSDEADIVYHEYTHGLSNRLVTDADSNPALDTVQAGSMGEAWSDWYALDYLVNQGSIKDSRKPGDVDIGRLRRRRQAASAPRPRTARSASTAEACPGTGARPRAATPTATSAGSTTRRPEVHADGEIWAQTLWDLRSRARPASWPSRW